MIDFNSTERIISLSIKFTADHCGVDKSSNMTPFDAVKYSNQCYLRLISCLFQ